MVNTVCSKTGSPLFSIFPAAGSEIDVQHDKTCTEKNSADNIGNPMDSCENPADYHEEGEGGQDERCTAPENGIFDPVTELQDGGRHTAQREQGG